MTPPQGQRIGATEQASSISTLWPNADSKTELDKNIGYKREREFSDSPQHPSLGQKDSRGNQEKIQTISRYPRRHHLDTLNSNLTLGCPSSENDFRFLIIWSACQPLSYVILKSHLLLTDKKKHLAQAAGRVLRDLVFLAGRAIISATQGLLRKQLKGSSISTMC